MINLDHDSALRKWGKFTGIDCFRQKVTGKFLRHPIRITNAMLGWFSVFYSRNRPVCFDLGNLQMFFCAFNHCKMWDIVFITRENKLWNKIKWYCYSCEYLEERLAFLNRFFDRPFHQQKNQINKTSLVHCFLNTRFHQTSYQQFFFKELMALSFFWNLSWLR